MSAITSSSNERLSEPEGCFARNCEGIKEMLENPINVLLVFVPLGIVSGLQDWGCTLTFTFNFFAIVPLAGLLGGATEALALHTGEMIGGLLNATFGNAVEMIVTINAIRMGLISVVQASLIGSILSNLLLVLGMAFVASAYHAKEVNFNQLGSGTSVSCLVLASLALVIPTVYNGIPGATLEGAVDLSRFSSMVLLCIYALFLVFQLLTHADAFGGGEEEEETTLDFGVAGVLLFAVTCIVAISSEFLVGSIEEVSVTMGLPKAFIGMILLPIIGNAAEHTTAVTVAMRGKMDLCLGVAVGSATQIALFVIPFSVMVGWYIDVPMALDFHSFMACVFVLSAFVASSVLQGGSAHWFGGALLCAAYVMIAVICWFLPNQKERTSVDVRHLTSVDRLVFV